MGKIGFRILQITGYLFKLKKIYDKARIGAYSAQAAFFMLLSAVPLVMMAVIVIGAAAPFDVIGVGQMLSQIFTESANEYIMALFDEIAGRSTIPLVSVTMLFLVWAATKGIRSIADGIHNIYGCGAQYNIVWLTIRSVLYTFVMFVVFVLSVVVLVFASPLERLITNLLGEGASVLLAVLNMRNIILFFAFTLLFALAYKVLAKSGISFRNQLPGAAVASAGWILYSFGYSVYIRYFSRYSALYGSFGAVMLFMLWLYMCMNILLCGALANKIINSKKCD